MVKQIVRKRRRIGKGSIFQTKRGDWVFSIVRNGKRTVRYFPSYRDAELEQVKWVRDHNLQAGANQTVGQYLNGWLEQKTKLRPGTARRYRQIVNLYANPLLGGIRVDTLTRHDVQRAMAQMIAKGTKAGTANKLRAVLRSALEELAADGKVARNVAADAEPAQDRAPFEPHALTDGEYSRFVAALEGDPLERLFRLMLSTGIREGEALALRWEDIDFDAQVIHIRATLDPRTMERGEPKSRSGRRMLALSEENAAMLNERRGIKGYVFQTSEGTPYQARNVVRSFKRILRKAGLSELIRVHDLRGTAITNMERDGVIPSDMQRIAGHSDVRTTLKYYSQGATESQRAALALASKRAYARAL